MQTSITFKNLDSSENLKSYAIEKLNRFDKYLYNPAEANVVLSVEKFRHIAEVSIIGDKLKINGKDETTDMYSAIDLVLDKLEIQIKKNRQKIKKHRNALPLKLRESERDSIYLDDETEKQVIINNIDYKPMDVEEAIMQMDIINNNFLVFSNSRTDEVNVLYIRKDGNYGLIQPHS